MSDFDKEAEREKLRKKYERDQADREATQRMSDLLLKGARMTNTHCDTCGDPLFEQNDVTFCPTCHGGPGGVEASLAGTETTDDESAEAAGAQSEAANELPEGSSVDGFEPPLTEEMAATAERDAEPTRGDKTDTESASASRSSGAERRPIDDETVGASRQPSRTGDARAPVSSGTVDGDLKGARDALVESLERFAREAAQTTDPRYAKDCLEAAHEAAETLSALR